MVPGLAVVAVATGVGVVATRPLAPAAGGNVPHHSTSVATAQRREIASTETFDGTVGFASLGSLTSTRIGTLTRLAAEGTELVAGAELARVDEQPITIMAGYVPMYRGLGAGVDDGPDVTQLETNLVQLGYAKGLINTADDHFDAATTAAVKRWQDATDQATSGLIEQGAVIVVSTLPARVGAHHAEVGAKVNDAAALVDLTTAARQVSMTLDAADRPKVGVGDSVDVVLPNGSNATATITTIGDTTSDADSGSDEPTGDSATPTFDVTVTLSDPAAVDHLDGAAVSISITQERHPDVVAVPVTALVALAEGGYAVERSPSKSLVPVDLGLFQDGWVEVTGIDAGTKVVVPT